MKNNIFVEEKQIETFSSSCETDITQIGYDFTSSVIFFLKRNFFLKTIQELMELMILQISK